MTKILDDAVNNLFGIREEHADKEVNAIYNKEKADANINNLIDFVIRGLCKLNKPFKYCVTGLLMQNNGSALNTCCKIWINAAMAFNDPNTDGAVTLQREVGQNIAVLTIFAFQIWWLLKYGI